MPKNIRGKYRMNENAREGLKREKNVYISRRHSSRKRPEAYLPTYLRARARLPIVVVELSRLREK